MGGLGHYNFGIWATFFVSYGLNMSKNNISTSRQIFSCSFLLRDDNGIYSELIGLLHYNDRLKPDEVAMLVTSLKAISGAVSYIDIVHHGTLLNTIFNMCMWSYGPDVMDALIELIVSLAASSGKFVDSCLDMLVCNFTPPRRFVESLKLPHGVAKKKHVLVRLHSALEYIASLVPLAPSRLLPIVLQRMPKVVNNLAEAMVAIFVENMFRLESGAIGELVGRRMLIMAVVDLLTDFDVEIGWDGILEENPHKGIFEMELEDEQMLDEGDDAHDGVRGRVRRSETSLEKSCN